MYSPKLGRFLSQDPLVADPTVLSDNNWFGDALTVMKNRYGRGFQADDINPYRYVGNNPTNRVDPTGLLYHEIQVIRCATRLSPQRAACEVAFLAGAAVGTAAAPYTSVPIAKCVVNTYYKWVVKEPTRKSEEWGKVCCVFYIQHSGDRFYQDTICHIPITEPLSECCDASGPETLIYFYVGVCHDPAQN